MWSDNYAPECGLYKSQCEYLKPSYFAWLDSDRLVDIGFLDKWWLAHKAMTDYDINPGEWDEFGRPKDAQSQLKQMW